MNPEGCGWLDAFGHPCNEEARGYITLRDSLIAGRVRVCSKHKAQYNRMAAQVRAARKGR